MKFLFRLLITTLAVLIIAYLFPNHWITVDSFGAALLVALVLGLLKLFVRPLLIILTIPITILTLGLFLFVINAVIILLADYIVTGFDVKGFWVALLFSLILSFLETVMYKIFKPTFQKISKK